MPVRDALPESFVNEVCLVRPTVMAMSHLILNGTADVRYIMLKILLVVSKKLQLLFKGKYMCIYRNVICFKQLKKYRSFDRDITTIWYSVLV